MSAPWNSAAVRFLWGVLICSAMVGCGTPNALDRQAISGNVTLDGTPLDEGTIEFLPLGPEGRAGGAVIRRGSYAIEGAKGLVPGKYTVRISSAASNREIDLHAPPGPTLPVMSKERIPPQYNTETKLVVEVKKEQSKTFDFALSSK